jgi:hypothetical protein
MRVIRKRQRMSVTTTGTIAPFSVAKNLCENRCYTTQLVNENALRYLQHPPRRFVLLLFVVRQWLPLALRHTGTRTSQIKNE